MKATPRQIPRTNQMLLRIHLSTLSAQPWKNTSRLMHQHRWTNERRTQLGKCKLQGITENTIYHIIYGPFRCLSLTESTVREVSSGKWDILAGAGKQQTRAVDDYHVTSPVLTTFPATALHLQTDRTTDFNSDHLQCGKWKFTRTKSQRLSVQVLEELFFMGVRFELLSRQEWKRLVRYYGFGQCVEVGRRKVGIWLQIHFPDRWETKN